jgi:hypothetical protein
MKNEKAIVVVSITGANRMKPPKRKEIANWLRRVGADLVKQGNKYDANFKASYFAAKR